MPNALIKFTQNAPGPGAGADGQALAGVTGTAVQVANVSNTGVDKWQFELLYVPPLSALTVGVKQAYSSTQTWSFTPDVSECYVVRLRVKDVNGNESVDDRVFAVAEDSGRIIMPAKARGGSLNFGGQTAGWQKYLREYQRMTDTIERETKAAKGTDLTNADATIQISAGRWRVLPAATLSANRVLTLGTTGAVAGDTFEITRLDTTAFTYAIANGGGGGGTLITFPVSKTACARCRYDGTNWALRLFGIGP